MSADDSALIERAKRGEREAFGALVRRHQKRVYATAFHMTGSHGDADDVAQEAFVRAYRGLPGFDGRADFSTWLHRIVVNVALNHLRARRRGPLVGLPAEDSLEVEVPLADPRRALESKQAIGAVIAALAELSPSLRVTLVLATIEELPYKTIAEILEIPEGTVAWRINQARKLLRARLTLAPGAAEESLDEVLRGAKEALGVPGPSR